MNAGIQCLSRARLFVLKHAVNSVTATLKAPTAHIWDWPTA